MRVGHHHARAPPGVRNPLPGACRIRRRATCNALQVGWSGRQRRGSSQKAPHLRRSAPSGGRVGPWRARCEFSSCPIRPGRLAQGFGDGATSHPRHGPRRSPEGGTRPRGRRRLAPGVGGGRASPQPAHGPALACATGVCTTSSPTAGVRAHRCHRGPDGAGDGAPRSAVAVGVVDGQRRSGSAHPTGPRSRRRDRIRRRRGHASLGEGSTNPQRSRRPERSPCARTPRSGWTLRRLSIQQLSGRHGRPDDSRTPRTSPCRRYRWPVCGNRPESPFCAKALGGRAAGVRPPSGLSGLARILHNASRASQ